MSTITERYHDHFADRIAAGVSRVESRQLTVTLFGETRTIEAADVLATNEVLDSLRSEYLFVAKFRTGTKYHSAHMRFFRYTPERERQFPRRRSTLAIDEYGDEWLCDFGQHVHNRTPTIVGWADRIAPNSGWER